MPTAWTVMIRAFLVAACLCATTAVSFDVAAQGQAQPDEPSKEVRELNDQAVNAIVDEEYARAIALLNESITVAKWNVTYLNLGRAYQLAGKCEKAKTALENAKTAPPVKEPRLEVVKATADRYLDELEECEQKKGAASASSGDEGPRADDEDSPSIADINEAKKKDQIERDSPTVGWVLLGTSVAALGTSGAFGILASQQMARVNNAEVVDGVYQIPETDVQDAEDKAATYGTIAMSAGIAGAVLAGLGTYFIVSHSNAESESSISISPRRDGASVELRLSF